MCGVTTFCCLCSSLSWWTLGKKTLRIYVLLLCRLGMLFMYKAPSEMARKSIGKPSSDLHGQHLCPGESKQATNTPRTWCHGARAIHPPAHMLSATSGTDFKIEDITMPKDNSSVQQQAGVLSSTAHTGLDLRLRHKTHKTQQQLSSIYPKKRFCSICLTTHHP